MSRIALLLPDLEMGGAQRVILMIAREFSKRGHRVELVLLSSTGPLLSDVSDSINVVDLSIRKFGLGQIGFLLYSVYRLARWLRENSPDVLMSTITGANLVALLARKNAHVSTRIVIREAVTLKNINSVLRLKAMRWLYPHADNIIALSSIIMAELVEKVGVSSSLVHCISNPVDADLVRKQALVQVDHPWLYDARLKVVISVGRLVLQKDYGTLLRAVALLPKEFSYRLIVIGDGPERESLEKLSIELKIDDVVQFVGFDANPWRWMARADLFVLSSRWEGHPNVLLEALVLGIPVVATEYDSSVNKIFSEIPNYPSRVVEVGRPDILVKAILRMSHGESVGFVNGQLIDATESIEAYERILLSSSVHL
ncbi:Glycosyltransferase [hydrothermal vent metagenome]|uniref:Glycosyltransferase n=1 Tax=hydrothermal vent metagenome TaxID=652676 RepID=A0A3B0W2E6_9ZZZZ